MFKWPPTLRASSFWVSYRYGSSDDRGAAMLRLYRGSHTTVAILETRSEGIHSPRFWELSSEALPDMIAKIESATKFGDLAFSDCVGLETLPEVACSGGVVLGVEDLTRGLSRAVKDAVKSYAPELTLTFHSTSEPLFVTEARTTYLCNDVRETLDWSFPFDYAKSDVEQFLSGATWQAWGKSLLSHLRYKMGQAGVVLPAIESPSSASASTSTKLQGKKEPPGELSSKKRKWSPARVSRPERLPEEVSLETWLAPMRKPFLEKKGTL